MGKWTPGPWHSGVAGQNRWITAESGEHVAFLGGQIVEGKPIDANGRLIAAAPELYEALEWMLTLHADMYDRLKAKGVSRVHLECMNSARELLARLEAR